jgi:mevalonate kinase
MRDFTTTTFGKWILAGEHAVLRGCPALAFPLMSKALQFTYDAEPGPLDVVFSGSHGEELKLLFYGVIETAVRRLNVSKPLKGKFQIKSELPVGAGLGASAALCGAVSRWCAGQSWIGENEVYEFARKLEDLFHGESSGVDLAVSLSAQGVHFERGGKPLAMSPAWWPGFYLSYSGARGMTSDCVAKVKRLFETDLTLAENLDRQMRESVSMAERALGANLPSSRSELESAIHLARDCFERWGLCAGDLSQHMQGLTEAGAMAVKPTGSGGGGFVLSLWSTEPPISLRNRLVRVPPPHL